MRDCGNCLWFYEETVDVPYGLTSIVTARIPKCWLGHKLSEPCPGSWVEKRDSPDLNIGLIEWFTRLREEMAE